LNKVITSKVCYAAKPSWFRHMEYNW